MMHVKETFTWGKSVDPQVSTTKHILMLVSEKSKYTLRYTDQKGTCYKGVSLMLQL